MIWCVSLDYDGADAWERVERACAKIAERDPDAEIEIEETARGYHVIVHLSEPVSVDEMFTLREELGDDPKRIEIDRVKVRNGRRVRAMVVFTRKRGRCVRYVWAGKAREWEVVYRAYREHLEQVERARSAVAVSRGVGRATEVQGEDGRTTK